MFTAEPIIGVSFVGKSHWQTCQLVNNFKTCKATTNNKPFKVSQVIYKATIILAGNCRYVDSYVDQSMLIILDMIQRR